MYLKIDFGDNDFGHYVVLALKRLWADIHGNNAHCITASSSHFSDRSVPQMFQELHQAGALKTMIDAAINCEHAWGAIEFATRGLYWPKIDWESHKVIPERSGIAEYLQPTIAFRKRRPYAWSNGESAWLDLKTGEAASF